MIGKDVQGTVTAEIKDQPWDVALQAILQAQGLAASEENTGIISVDSYANILAKEANEPLTTQLVAINYANASSLVQTIAVAAVQGLLEGRPDDGRLGRHRQQRRQHSGRRDVHRPRRRRRRHVDQHAPRHRGGVADAGPDELHQGSRRPHAAGGAARQDHLGEPHVGRAARSQL